MVKDLFDKTKNLSYYNNVHECLEGDICTRIQWN